MSESPLHSPHSGASVSEVESATSAAIADLPLADTAMADAVRRGFAASQKFLPAWLFYDAEGSRLFERITELPEYYLTRTERAIFAAHAGEIIAAALHAYATARSSVKSYPSENGQEPLGGKLRILELGAGSASKTGILLEAAVRAQGETDYLPVDVSPSAMEEACDSLSRCFPSVRVRPQVANYVTDALDIPMHDGPTLALYIGSSIGNFSTDEATAILQNLRAQLRPGDTLLLGTDLVKDAGILEAAYDDQARITAAFNLNVLRRLNRELGANFDMSGFHHVACFNRQQSRIEMHLRSTRAQRVAIPALQLSIPFQAGETIHTENSYKFTPQSLRELLNAAGFCLSQTWTDEQGWFAVTLSSVPN